MLLTYKQLLEADKFQEERMFLVHKEQLDKKLRTPNIGDLVDFTIKETLMISFLYDKPTDAFKAAQVCVYIIWDFFYQNVEGFPLEWTDFCKMMDGKIEIPDTEEDEIYKRNVA